MSKQQVQLKEKELSIEDLAPYLPYGLKMLNTKSGSVIDVIGLTNSVDTFCIHSIIKNGQSIEYKDYQANLWPLKLLLKEPTPDLLIKYGIKFKANIMSINAAMHRKMIREMVDVFGLIDAGLALDINFTNG